MGRGDIFPQHHFYKQPAKFGQFIDQLKQGDDAKEFEGFVLTVKPPYHHEYDTILLLKEQIGTISDRPIFRYHFCSDWIFSYWKCCADIACCIAQAQMRNIYLAGKYVEIAWLTKMSEARTLPGYDFDLSEIDLPRIGRWAADEFVDIPEKFVTPLSKSDGYSIESAINRWLGYHDKGWIYVHSGRVNNGAKRAFQDYIKV